MKTDRGGLCLKTGKIGRVNCLKQTLMMPGERINMDIQGTVRLETLRERDVMRINAHIATFWTPLRWLWSEFPQYLTEGPDTAVVPPTLSNESNWDSYGVGSYRSSGDGTLFKPFSDNVLRCYNEWYKWPEDSDETTWVSNGRKAVPLSAVWSRARYNMTPTDSDDYAIDVSNPTMDVRDLATTQARFRSAMKREILTFGRWMETLQNVYNGDGSREVDQVPIMLDQQEVGVNPREMPATDGASLGQWQSMFDFNVDHQVNGIIAPEHGILATFLVIRFAPVIESCDPLATDRPDWWELTGDPEYLSNAEPVQVQRRDYEQTNSSTVMGYLGAGWQWRCETNVIGQSIDQRDSFPYMLTPTTQAEAKDATRVKDAFRSQALDDYMVDLYFRMPSIQPIGTALDSYFSGMVDDTTPRKRNSNAEFPEGGKNL